MKILRLAVKKAYFDQIRSEEKQEEFRLKNKFWTTRIQNKNFDYVIITLGYPNKTDLSRHLFFKYNGYCTKLIKHEHFDANSFVEVFAIDLSTPVNADAVRKND